MAGIKSTQTNAVAISKVYKQEDGDLAWVDNTPSIDYKLPEIVVEGDTTSTALKSFNVVAQGDNVRVYNGIDGLVDGALGTVSINTLPNSSNNLQNIITSVPSSLGFIANTELSGSASNPISSDFRRIAIADNYIYYFGCGTNNNVVKKAHVSTPTNLITVGTVSNHYFGAASVFFHQQTNRFWIYSGVTSLNGNTIRNIFYADINTPNVFVDSGYTIPARRWMFSIAYNSKYILFLGGHSKTPDLAYQTEWYYAPIDQPYNLTQFDSVGCNAKIIVHNNDFYTFGYSTNTDYTMQGCYKIDGNTLERTSMGNTPGGSSYIPRYAIKSGSNVFLIGDGPSGTQVYSRPITSSGAWTAGGTLPYAPFMCYGYNGGTNLIALYVRTTGTNPYTYYFGSLKSNSNYSSISVDSQLTINSIDISTLNLTNPPTKAYLDKPVTVSTATEANASRCIAQDEVLDKVSSTTTEFVGTNAISGLITTGDSIQVDGTTDVVCSDVVETYVSVDNTATHDIFGDSSAVATYNLDGNANDLGGTYNGTATGVTYGAGKFNQAGIFNGSSKIENTSFDISSYSAVTFSCWMSTTTSGGSLMGFSGSNDMAIQTINSTTCRLYFRSNLNFTDVSDFFINDGTWHHYAFVIDSNGANHYKDGASVTTTGQVLSTVTTTFDIGNVTDTNGNNSYFNGKIDQVRIFNKALTSDEVTTLYNEQIPKYQYKCTIPSQATAPVSAKVLDRSITTTEASDTYDDTTSKFTKTYNKIAKQGRAFKYKIEADTDVEIDKITIPMNKQG